jgi:hypothetical protein
MISSNFWARISGAILLAGVATNCFAAWADVHAELVADNTESYCLVISCKNDGAVVEIYAPQRICYRGYDEFFKDLQSEQRGLYALDLNGYDKGKSLEPINLRATRRNSGIIVDQFTRRLPATTVPREGGKVSFDNRFATDMLCSPLFETGSMPK